MRHENDEFGSDEYRSALLSVPSLVPLLALLGLSAVSIAVREPVWLGGASFVGILLLLVVYVPYVARRRRDGARP